MVNSTNFTKATTVSTNHSQSSTDTSVILLETGDKLLLENGADAILIETSLSPKSTNFTKATTVSTNYS